jgi:hypothetical protein
MNIPGFIEVTKQGGHKNLINARQIIRLTENSYIMVNEQEADGEGGVNTTGFQVTEDYETVKQMIREAINLSS